MKVFLHGLECHAFHGVPDEEQAIGHRYLIDLTATVPDPAGEDHLGDSVDYAAMGAVALEVMSSPPCRTVEYLAWKIGTEVLHRFSAVQDIEVTVQKIHPPAPMIAESAGVEVTLSRSGAPKVNHPG